MNIFTFWEGTMPDYIKLCMDTWKFDYELITYDTLYKYTDFEITDILKKFSLPKIADCIRAHVLRDNGGYWLDADTIIIGRNLPEETMIGNPKLRTNSIGYLYAERPNMDLFVQWSGYQDYILENAIIPSDTKWDVFGNHFTDSYVQKHKEISIKDITCCCPETYMLDSGTRRERYTNFYFNYNYKLSDIAKTDMIMLHNSWTPKWYKEISKDAILACPSCTLSNILKEVSS